MGKKIGKSHNRFIKYAISGLKTSSEQPPHSPAKMLPDGTWVDISGAAVDGGWPPDWGFVKHHDVAQAALTMVPKGALIDRFGSKYGTFFSQPNVSLRKRSMLPLGEKTAYTVYKVVKPFSALVGIIAPWFGEPGGGVQIMANRSAEELLKSGRIRRVTKKTIGGGVRTSVHRNTKKARQIRSEKVSKKARQIRSEKVSKKSTSGRQALKS